MKRVEVFTHRRGFLEGISKEAELKAPGTGAMDALRRAPQQDQLMLEWENE
ncbi:hypothetical protein [Alteromonas sp. BMJM2]|uniref:hypothetical protein n=1 Tax=Alteromonas sp. BMJM2 TaxID=2954241 RepID=UPI0022B5D209|nr:hypothetical protein [Alteromonas sp. BMJM2]